VAGVDDTVFEAATGQKNQLSIGQEVVFVDPKYFRPTEVELLIGDATKARTKLGWSPKYKLQDLVTDMMQSDIKVMQKETYLKEGGFQTKNYFE
jgi:GDPmannose 4,6-dehydratase